MENNILADLLLILNNLSNINFKSRTDKKQVQKKIIELKNKINLLSERDKEIINFIYNLIKLINKNILINNDMVNYKTGKTLSCQNYINENLSKFFNLKINFDKFN